MLYLADLRLSDETSISYSSNYLPNIFIFVNSYLNFDFVEISFFAKTESKIESLICGWEKKFLGDFLYSNADLKFHSNGACDPIVTFLEQKLNCKET